ncbi:MAG: hypothetical protein ACD_81C00126G0018 [uncultured bacterium]|uniref:UDP-N-acetylglucosamine--N-acetylmuramyl-(pentapeptide) pyrophosphoryl-undecaprenol N-acetylglucosamine transferase n=2 Tax=Candidatus Wolfeibacteriota TaxID=1752735 RepID=A0A0G1HBB9_9BACT|nr:MAG: hypothetical protein ACD_81C00126G0018 [uncultured bacterium]KKR12897.1 MAG: hypothetical protein UT41_C0001G0441 [Candidatus Wolfebacteria bacterium GW2011_GWC2_39_22]KKT43828.1 MAG: hypothetical protein UW32_C0001G0420 [Candidatus Wolfebacteria bacterium GW2011_GWE2_44_13]HBI25444.1 hypothetical protein [Candidatus Wolfebacteria bacterium]
MRILFTGGVTGGHIYPLVSVAEKILKAGNADAGFADLYYVGVPGVYQQLLESKGIIVSRIASAKLRRGDVLRNLIDLPVFFISVLQALWQVFWIMPDVLFSKGGPGALPVVLACAFYRIPIIIHESDSVAGLTSAASARFAKRIGIAYVAAKESFIPRNASERKRSMIEQKIALIGNPIREFFFANTEVDKEGAKRLFDFDPAKPLILIMGGSQGAVRINEFILSVAEDLLSQNMQILHQVGTNNFTAAEAEMRVITQKYSDALRRSYRMVPYFEQDLREAYLAADLVISRAGSGSIFEIAAMGCPAILIPLPESISRDQVKNAFEYAATGAAITLEESNLTKHIFFNQLERLTANPETFASMAAAAKAFARPDAAETLASEIIRLGSRQ